MVQSTQQDKGSGLFCSHCGYAEEALGRQQAIYRKISAHAAQIRRTGGRPRPNLRTPHMRHVCWKSL
ncbi:hypothetical protein FKM82_000037 [Ascaphus truei]